MHTSLLGVCAGGEGVGGDGGGVGGAMCACARHTMHTPTRSPTSAAAAAHLCVHQLRGGQVLRLKRDLAAEPDARAHACRVIEAGGTAGRDLAFGRQ